MRATLLLEQWILLIGGVLLGLLIIVLFWGFVADIAATECWKGVIKPFEGQLTSVTGMSGSLGSKALFYVNLNLNDACLGEIAFTTSQSGCNSACERSGMGSKKVYACKDECTEKCKSRGCIMLLPKSSWHVFQSNTLVERNNIKIYNGGGYSFSFGTGLRLAGSLKPGSGKKCLEFSNSGLTANPPSKQYDVEAKGEGECK